MRRVEPHQSSHTDPPTGHPHHRRQAPAIGPGLRSGRGLEGLIQCLAPGGREQPPPFDVGGRGVPPIVAPPSVVGGRCGEQPRGVPEAGRGAGGAGDRKRSRAVAHALGAKRGRAWRGVAQNGLCLALRDGPHYRAIHTASGIIVGGPRRWGGPVVICEPC